MAKVPVNYLSHRDLQTDYIYIEGDTFLSKTSPETNLFRLLNRGLGVRRRRIRHPDPEVLPGLFAFPAHPLKHGPNELDGAFLFARTDLDTVAAVPALVWINHKGWVVSLGMRHEDVVHAGFDALVAAAAIFGIDSDRPVWSHQVSG
jgi:hypothetical protein